ncbi:MAG: patatin-like phospholipase family protein [Rhodopila sp.]|nr:patatin-like phospholipase family protein [Rhodopila sp.]
MDILQPSRPLPALQPARAPWRPAGCDNIALVLQGGGALGAYQAGIYQALYEAGLQPDTVAGVSIGGINAAIIAGNPPERRVEQLRTFWEGITARPVSLFTPDGDFARKATNAWSSLLTTLLGQPGFFTPNKISPWLSPRGTKTATAFYDTTALRETLLRLVDFDLLNRGTVRYAAGAVNVLNGNFAYFDNTRTTILPEHVMASGALPPALPMVQVGTDYYWDGGLVSNTPLQHVLDNAACLHMLVFQVDLFSARGPLPRDMYDVLARQKDIQYSSRTRFVTDYFRAKHDRDLLLKTLLAKIPDDQLNDDERKLKALLANMPEATILELIYQQAAYETQAKDYEFSAASMSEHWNSGYLDMQRTLRHRDWLTVPTGDSGVVVHDIHRVDD